MRRQAAAVAFAASPVLRQAAALALGAAVSLGLARFSYALLLPPMRADLGWSYLTAGMMNTVNALGYLFGALLVPRLLRRYSPRGVLLAGSAATAVLLAAHGLVLGEGALLLLRLGSGMASAFTFVCGGLLAARLGSAPGDGVVHGAHPPAALVLGLYYGGTGLGIIVSAAIVPPLADLARAHAWQSAWLALAAVALLATAQMAAGTRALSVPAPGTAGKGRFALRRFAYALAAYLMFGLGYIGYMTFNVTLLREQGMASGGITLFYLALGLGVVASSWLWADLLQRHRGGVPMAVLNGLLALATALPVLSQHVAAAFVSAALFGSVFLSVVASTTALVRHNADPPPGQQASPPSPSSLRSGRSSGQCWWAGWPTGRAGWWPVSPARPRRWRWVRCWRGGSKHWCPHPVESQRGARKLSMRASSSSSDCRKPASRGGLPAT